MNKVIKRGRSPIFRSLANNKATRNEHYKVMFAEYLSSGEIDMIRQSSQTGTSLGNDYFTNPKRALFPCAHINTQCIKR